ncbi:hypothetical protein VTH06DRAFT_4863 [Thermothelomyces fergusii]
MPTTIDRGQFGLARDPGHAAHRLALAHQRPPPGRRSRAVSASLEQHFARSLALAQPALGSLLLVLSGALPLDPPGISPDTSNPTPSASAACGLWVLLFAGERSKKAEADKKREKREEKNRRW